MLRPRPPLFAVVVTLVIASAWTAATTWPAPARARPGARAPAAVTAPTPAHEEPGAWRRHLAAGREAFLAGDLATARVELTALDAIVGGHAGAMYALAQIAARTGDRAGALQWLEESARTGLERRVADDTSFAALAGDAAFQALAARFAGNGRAIARAKVVTRLGDAAMLAEDVVYDAPGRRWLVSSIRWRKIVSVTSGGIVENLIQPLRDDVWGIYGLAIDPPRGRLWASTAAEAAVAGYDAADSNRTALIAFTIADGHVIERLELPRDGARHVLGDLCVGPDGTVYATDAIGGGVYRVPPGGGTLETLAPPGTFASPQCPALAADGRRLFVPDYARGIAAVALRTGEVTWLPKPRTLASGGIDGLYAAGKGLIAIQNGTTPHRVLALDLDPAQTRITGWRVLEQASPELGEPNHGVVMGRDFVFIGNSGWERVRADTLETPPGTPAPALLRLEKVVAR